MCLARNSSGVFMPPGKVTGKRNSSTMIKIILGGPEADRDLDSDLRRKKEAERPAAARALLFRNCLRLNPGFIFTLLFIAKRTGARFADARPSNRLCNAAARSCARACRFAISHDFPAGRESS